MVAGQQADGLQTVFSVNIDNIHPGNRSRGQGDIGFRVQKVP